KYWPRCLPAGRQRDAAIQCRTKRPCAARKRDSRSDRKGRLRMPRFEELQQKYSSVIRLAQQQGVRLTHVNLQDNKLFVQGAAPPEAVKNNIWNQIKLVNPAYDDIVADITIDSSLAQPAVAAAATARVYRVQSGDSLSKIAKQFYGNANDYMRIFD